MSTIILSIDGGGIRGILPLYILNELRNRLDNMDINLPFYQLCNLIAGTSTGSLIALMLSSYDNKELDDTQIIALLMKLYTNNARDIFPQSKCKLISYPKQLFSSKYKQTNLYKLLDKYLNNTTLKDAKTNLLIPVLNLKDSTPYFFKNRPAYYKYYTDLNFYMKDIGIAATAAPTYFPPAIIHPINVEEPFYFVDGGIFANDPSLCAFIESLKIFSKEKHFILISLGTGQKKLSFDVNNPDSWGILKWMDPCNNIPLLSILLNTQPKLSQYMLNKLPNISLYRFDIELEEDNFSLDDSSKEYIDFLHKKGKELISNNSDLLDKLVKQIRIARLFK